MDISMVNQAYLMPNPEEFYPTVDEFLGKATFGGKISTSNKALKAGLKPEAIEAVGVPAAFIGNFPVMTGDRESIVWSNACGGL